MTGYNYYVDIHTSPWETEDERQRQPCDTDCGARGDEAGDTSSLFFTFLFFIWITKLDTHPLYFYLFYRLYETRTHARTHTRTHTP